MSTTGMAITPEELIPRIGTPTAPLIFDVRRAEAFANSARMIPGARWRSHLETEEWGAVLDQQCEIAVYCVHGHHVSQMTAASLRAMGHQVRFLKGGFDAFAAHGGATVQRNA